MATLLTLTSPRIPIKHPNFKGHLSSVYVVYIGREHFSVDCMHDALGYCTRKSKTTVMYSYNTVGTGVSYVCITYEQIVL